MTNKLIAGPAAFIASLLLASPALAQEEPALPDDPNSLTIGVGGAYMPSYEGSDDYIFTPVGLVFGKVAGFSFATRGTSLSLDLIRDDTDAGVSIDLGPVVNVRLDRTSRIKDAQVRALGEIDTAIELGGFAGIHVNGLLHQYDSLNLRFTYQQDVTDTHDSSVMTPSVEYITPLSTKTLVTLSASAERVGEGYADTYFSISPAGAVASGLPAFDADSGWKRMTFGLFLGQVLTGDLRDPGLSLFAGATYSKLKNDFKDSPIVSVAGDSDQYLATLGLAYSF